MENTYSLQDLDQMMTGYAKGREIFTNLAICLVDLAQKGTELVLTTRRTNESRNIKYKFLCAEDGEGEVYLLAYTSEDMIPGKEDLHMVPVSIRDIFEFTNSRSDIEGIVFNHSTDNIIFSKRAVRLFSLILSK